MIAVSSGQIAGMIVLVGACIGVSWLSAVLVHWRQELRPVRNLYLLRATVSTILWASLAGNFFTGSEADWLAGICALSAIAYVVLGFVIRAGLAKLKKATGIELGHIRP